MHTSPSTFGLSDSQWAEAGDELRRAILDAAWDRRMTNYSEIAEQVAVVHVDPFSALMNHLLGAVCELEHQAGRPMLTAIVTHKHGDKEPGPGFYEMARALGYRFSEPYVFWSTQVQDVFKMHGRPDRTRSRRG